MQISHGYVADCCGVGSLNQISDIIYDNPKRVFDPEEAVARFVGASYTRVFRNGRFRTVHGKYAAQYVFTEVTSCGPDRNIVPKKYGAKLAAYIRKNKLGHVAVSKPAPNRRNVPDHVLKTYVWTPDVAGLEAWAKPRTRQINKWKGYGY